MSRMIVSVLIVIALRGEGLMAALSTIDNFVCCLSKATSSII